MVASHSDALNIPFEIFPEKKKRFRRTAQQIKKSFMCPIDRCQRKYGTEGSLGQHMKLKHAEEYKKIMTELRQKTEDDKDDEEEQQEELQDMTFEY